MGQASLHAGKLEDYPRASAVPYSLSVSRRTKRLSSAGEIAIAATSATAACTMLISSFIDIATQIR